MRSSFQIARLFGIPVKLHWTFGLMLIYVYFIAASNGGAVGWYFLFFAALFFCVVLHEFGHALTARRFGVETQDIILSPIGGIARLQRLPDKPMQEFWVAIAGPAVNVVILLLIGPWFLGYSLADILDPVEPAAGLNINAGTFWAYVFLLNVMLVLFNLLPAFPMDGGRVLRALLATRLGRVKATQIASYIGKGMAVLFIGYGIFYGGLTTALIGVFVYLMANQEYRSVKQQAIFNEQTVADVLSPRVPRLPVTTSVQAALDAAGENATFLVTDEAGAIIGSVTRRQLRRTYDNGHRGIGIGNILRPVPSISPLASLQKLIALFRRERPDAVSVVEDGNLVGVVEVSALNKYLAQVMR